MTISDTRPFGPNAVCQRTACADRDAHVGGVHLDPTSELYDGPDTMLRALPYNVRDKAFALLHASRKEGWNRQLVDVALDAMGDEIHRLREQVAHVQVDKDRSVREASKRALDCEEHGKVIRGLEEQLTTFDKAQERANKGRLALLGGIKAFDDFVRGCDAKVKLGEQLPEMKTVLESIRGVLKKVHAAHNRAWSK